MEMSFGSLVRELSATEVTDVTTTTKRKVSEPKFEIALQSYPDIVITKETERTRKHLILMPTQGLYYIKTENTNGKGEPVTVKIDADNMNMFCHGCKIAFADVWFSRLPENKKECEFFLRYINNDKAQEMLKYHACPDLNYNYMSMYGSPMQDDIDCAYRSFEACPSIYKDYFNNERFVVFMKNNPALIEGFKKAYGASGVRSLIDTMIISLTNVRECWTHSYSWYSDEGERIFKLYNMDMQTAIDYICYSSVRMGFADSMQNFFRTWKDTLRMQVDLYGKVKEKYPEDLLTLHNKLSYQERLHREEIDERRFGIMSVLTKRFEMQIGDWVFIAPTKPDDFRDEATQQANCLAGYIRKYANGECHIMFMRKASAPDQSVVTIELSNDEELRLRQAYQACNKTCTAEQKSVIDKWLDAIRNRKEIANA